MTSGDFSFSLNVAGTQKTGEKRYIARPFEAHAVGDEALILASGDEACVRAPLFYTRMLAQLGEFRTLDAHAEAVIEIFALPAEQRGAIRQGLEGLVERGLLEDEQQVFSRLGHRVAEDEPKTGPIRTLCIRSCERPDDLEQLLASLGRRAAGSGLARVLVLDDSRNAEANARSAEAIRRAGLPPDLEIIHIDRAVRQRLSRRMATAAAVDPGHLDWLIEGDADDPAASYGSNLNLALLLTAGERFAIIDDDARLDPFGLDVPRSSLSLRVAHEFQVRYPDPDQAELAQFAALDLNPIAAHAAFLGQPVGAIAARHGLQDGHLLNHLSPQMIHDFSAQPRVRLTTNGTLGDSGTGDMLWQYSLPVQQLQAWLTGPEQYRRLAFGRRVARSTLETQIASSVSLMTTTLTGVDNRELLLPVGAKGSGEDLMFGSGIRFLYPGTPCAALPWMLPHRMDSARQWTSDDLGRRRGTGLTVYLSARIEAFSDNSLPTEPAARSTVLARWLGGFGQMSERDLIIDLRRHLLDRRSTTAARVTQTLLELDPPDWLRTDFQTLIDRHRELGSQDTAALERLAPQVQRFASAYGAALDTWVATWQWAAKGGTRDLIEENA